jgi:crescentin
MAKLSDLFGRKGGAAEVDKLLARAANGNGNGGNHISVENLSDVGSRMGEENEVLRNLLTDTGRKINELDDLKEASTSWLGRSTAPSALLNKKNPRR